MEFWGVEVKPGQAVKVDEMELGGLIHISQVALGEASKKEGKSNEPVVVYLKVGEQKLVLGTLIRDNIPHISLDIVLDKEFELSHTSKNAAVHFVGYTAEDDNDDGPFDDYSESDEDVELIGQDNGKPEAKAEKTKVAEAKKVTAGAPVKQVKQIADPKKVEEDDNSEDEDESGSLDEMDADSDEEDESDDDEDDEETPVKKVDQGKKRPNESASKTPVSAKKAKNATPEKTDGKKNVHTSTPHPMKKGGKTPNSVAKGKSPSSGGQLSGKTYNKTFNNGSGLQQHKKVKHGGK